MRYYLPQIADREVLYSDAGLCVLSHETLVQGGRDTYVYSRIPDAFGQRTYEVRKIGEQAFVAVYDHLGNREHSTQAYPSVNHARAVIVEALIRQTKVASEQISRFIPEEVLGIQAAEMA
jgi:hypothetical protein